uniref:Uncharacterized protein n=1 Tax=Anguilla anguilla TaxID=7936 RepID=A0A0E9UUS7_ANGAN
MLCFVLPAVGRQKVAPAKVEKFKVFLCEMNSFGSYMNKPISFSAIVFKSIQGTFNIHLLVRSMIAHGNYESSLTWYNL